MPQHSISHTFTSGASQSDASIRLGRVFAVSCVAAIFDLLFSIGFWAPRNVSVSRIFYAMAAWVMGPTPSPGVLRIAVGLVVQLSIYVIMTAALAILVHVTRDSGRRWYLTGAVFGVIAYLIIFQFAVPLIAAPIVPSKAPDWVAACIVVHAALLGPLIRRGLMASVRVQ